MQKTTYRTYAASMALLVAFAAPPARGDSAYEAIDKAQDLLNTKDHQQALKLLESAVAELRNATTKGFIR